MMRRVFALATLAALAGCGADGPPVAPPAKADVNPAQVTGLVISGEATMGIARKGAK